MCVLISQVKPIIIVAIAIVHNVLYFLALSQASAGLSATRHFTAQIMVIGQIKALRPTCPFALQHGLPFKGKLQKSVEWVLSARCVWSGPV